MSGEFNLNLDSLVRKANAAQRVCEAKYAELDAAIIVQDYDKIEEERNTLLLLHEAYIDLYIELGNEQNRRKR